MKATFIEIAKKIQQLDVTFKAVSNSTGREVCHFKISWAAAASILIFIFLDIYIFLAYSIQIWQVDSFRQKIAWRDELIKKIIAEKPYVKPVLNRSDLLEVEFVRCRKENQAMIVVWDRIRQKNRFLFQKSGRSLFKRRNGKKITLHSLSHSGTVVTALDQLENNLNQLEPILEKEVAEQQQLYEGLKTYEHRLDHMPSLYPVKAKVCSRFGIRMHPIHKRYIMHDGVDMAAVYGSKVQSAADGVVIFADWAKGYGLTVVISHDYGYQTCYGHNSLLLVHPGETVKKGQTICLSGNSGVSTGPHVHYEVRFHGKPINPVPFLKEKRQNLKIKTKPFRGNAFNIIAFAKKMLDTPYPNTEALPKDSDCSSFTRYVFRRFGFIIPPDAAEQAEIGIPVLKNRLHPGDLVFFSGDEVAAINHVGIYLGNNQFIHVSPDFGTVCIDSLKDTYYRMHYITARRVAEYPNL